MNNDMEQRSIKLLSYLRSLKDNRGAMADLRCAVSDTRRHRAWPWLAAVGGIESIVIETVAGLYAHHPEETQDGACRSAPARNWPLGSVARGKPVVSRFAKILYVSSDLLTSRN